MTLSKRLSRVAELIPAGARLADIGSDHAYLPAVLASRRAIEHAIAVEVASTPFAAAQRTVRKQGVEQWVSVRQGDGLAGVHASDRLTAISLCGMGGETIRDILQAGKARLNGGERLVMQPNGGEQPLRRWLMEHGYRIVAEQVLREHRFDYEIIVAEPDGPVAYSERELYFGPLLLKERGDAFINKWQRMLGQRQQTLANFGRARQAVPAAKLEQVHLHIHWISELLG
ncbi:MULTISPECIES: tRNA (adenine(22)-N(1))-methyltransferase TrmK [unclassified Pseudomonas]|uniref:tRNA (adenine(22)-N(1))-methyltransferase n=1 Tax=unclassified Pseudomonas TaxID=196821 RepID=UPI000BC4E3E2|nr:MULTISPECIES: tRNA (adenine(22)-N(1))-methyltransferase TrmK [unclassified Pseudomonas]PVZ19554.1 tRNA (adenine22-N1)-methyltransferase [Pseudomonas sp. URIL14HWK12:I12]PVZ22861.1 tRNA (adenine22-N1)-methyltransferase [Pseudomonas sp. URIL14HWK12:I10]PVZ37509.1 tRNA (adenine22-N1)-methyltransferase [Pseudomonas sp. URIL14HWK12:I11]SNZ14956.1 tRNA (adenine22-N1)-methyltransferase [Pseudomonas sp. URIL14HWK12:I9]